MIRPPRSEIETSTVGTRAGGEIESQPFAADDVPRQM